MKVLGLILLFGLPSFAYGKDRAPCTSFLMLVEQDAETMNLKMAGANQPQSDWYRKDGDQHEYAGVCLISPDKTGMRKAIVDGQDDPDGYLEQTIGDAPLYILGWEEHRVFVPDNNGGHYAFSANGILYMMGLTGDGKMIPIEPVHDTNRTIFSSSSLSLLKAAIKRTKTYRQRSQP